MLMTISRASRELGCSPEHIRRQIKAGKWPFYRLGRKALRLDVDEIRSLARLSGMAEKKGERSEKTK